MEKIKKDHRNFNINQDIPQSTKCGNTSSRTKNLKEILRLLIQLDQWKIGIIKQMSTGQYKITII